MHVAPTRPQPRTRLSGPQLAGWTPANRSDEQYAIHLDRDVAIALADGTGLRSWSRRLFPRVFPHAYRLATRHRHARPDWLDDYVRLVFDERFDGAFYTERSPREVLDRIAIPTCVSTNWGSVGLHIFGAFDSSSS
jgi:hypothetical protein